MSMPYTLLHIRIRQYQRYLSGSRFFILLSVVPLLLLIVNCFHWFQQAASAWITTGGLLFICFSIQASRNDLDFVYLHIAKPYRQILSEYACLVLPFISASLLTANWYCFFALLLSLPLVPFYRPVKRQRTRFRNLTRFISAKDFEWLGGLRKSYLIFLFLYGAAIAFCWVRILPLLLLWFVTLTCVSWYNDCEPLHILRASGQSPANFLRRKLFSHARYLVILQAPVLALQLFFHPQLWWAILLFLPLQIILLLFAISLKYSSYAPSEMNVGNNIVLSLVTLGGLIPFLLPLPLIMLLVYYFRARKNLETYLYD